MDPIEIAKARAIVAISDQIAALQQTVNTLDVIITEIQTTDAWGLVQFRIRARETGSSLPWGTEVDCLPFGAANTQNTLMGVQQARLTYQTQIDALNAQLAAL